MRRKTIYTLALIVWAIIVGVFYVYFDQKHQTELAAQIPQISVYKRQCPQLYPDPKLTPGKADTFNLIDLTAKYNGQTYSQSHRNVTSDTKNVICKEYNCNGSHEIDHFIPLSIGGSNGAGNLWSQPETNTCDGENWGYKIKDRLESFMAIQVKSGKIKPIDAQNCIANDWIQCYNLYIGKSLGSSMVIYDGEDPTN